MAGKTPIKVSAGTGKHKVDLVITPVGRDLLAVIFGGDQPHVGAVAVAIPRPSLKDAGRLSSTSSVITLTAHKDDQVAKMAAETLARKLNKVTVVSAGMHIDNASEADIRKLVRNAKISVEKAAKFKLPID